MLRKMFLVSEDHLNKAKKTKNHHHPPSQKTKKKQLLSRKHGPPKNNNKKKRKKNSNSQHDYDKWVKMRNQIREDQIRHDTQIKAIADFLQKVLPSQKQPQQSKRVSFKTEPLSDGEEEEKQRT
jgi:hypothetical protein